MATQTTQSIHVPVLLHEIIQSLIQDSGSKIHESPGFFYLDGTLGGAGHALAIAKAYEKAYGSKLNLIGLDREPQAIERAKASLEGYADKLILENESFRNLDAVLDRHQIAQADAILLDLGISSDELDESGRGFSFMRDEPLLMTMGDPAAYPFTALDIVNGWKEEDIANVIFGYGEERYAYRIARAIVSYREKAKIQTTFELAEIIKGSVPPVYRHGKINPSTRTFQALRIAVNDELNALREGIAKAYERLAPGGKLAVISFHSLEDRIVKEFFKKMQEEGRTKKGEEKKEKEGESEPIISKKPITASPQELAENPRSRSAKLRIIEKPL